MRRRFIMMMPDDDRFDGLAKHHKEFALLAIIAKRARRTPCQINGLDIGEAFLGDYRSYGMTERGYRTAKRNLEKWKFSTFKATSSGTVAKLCDASIYDINIEDSDEQIDRRPTDDRRTSDGQVTTNNKEKNVKKEKKDNKEELYTSKGKAISGTQLTQFDAFWESFGYKSGKREAAEAWRCLGTIDTQTFDAIIAGAKREAGRRPELIADGRTPKMAQGWLTGRRWEDEHNQQPELEIIR